MKPRAWSWIREQPHYRADAFLSGLREAGYEAQQGRPLQRARPGDVLVIWNRYDMFEHVADHWEADGGIVLVAENGYLGMDRDDRRIYALARHAHNGRGVWFPQGRERFEALKARLGIQLAPMDHRRAGYVLICPNRSFGMRGGVMPHTWAEDTARFLIGKWGERKEGVRIRYHPGNNASPVPLEQDLARARRVEIWSSSVGVRALLMGIPVTCHAPWWICKGWEQLGRGVALQNLAWAQWSVEEIADGTAYRHLLCRTAEAQVAERPEGVCAGL